jgi:hypothetical protein
MQLKGIGALALLVLAAIPARALEERIILSPGLPTQLAQPRLPVQALPRGAASFGDWTVDGAALRRGWRGAPEYAITYEHYAVEHTTDLLLHFDDPVLSDEAGEWSVAVGRSFGVDRERASFSPAAASFNGPDSELRLDPGPRALLSRDSRFRDFTIEFWLYPANAENGEVLLKWQSIRKAGKDALAQQLSCVISHGKITWSFFGFFVAPEGRSRDGTPFPAETSIDLEARSPLIPRVWTHQLLRFDGDSGLLEYLVNGLPEAMTHVTSTGHEGGTVFEPAIGGVSPLFVAANFSGLMDEFRITRDFVSAPKLAPFSTDPAIVISPIADLGFTNSRLIGIDAAFRTPGSTGIELSYRIADDAAGWKLDSPAWIPFRSGSSLPDPARGRFVQLRAELFSDGLGSQTPSLSAITLRFEPDPPPPPPSKFLAIVKNSAIELRWSAVPVEDLGGYLIYYGERPGEYFGKDAIEGPSPVDAGKNLSLNLSGLANGKLYYLSVASYDAAARRVAGGDPTARAGEFSQEVSARPSRTAP